MNPSKQSASGACRSLAARSFGIVCSRTSAAVCEATGKVGAGKLLVGCGCMAPHNSRRSATAGGGKFRPLAGPFLFSPRAKTR